MKERRLLEFLKIHELTVDEFHVIHIIHYGSHPPDRLIRQTVAESQQWFGRLPPTNREQCEEAFGSLMSRGLLQVVDEREIEQIKEELVRDPAYGPLDDLPEAGEVDFTKRGARLWERIEREVFQRTDTYGGMCRLEESEGLYLHEYVGTTKEIVVGCVEQNEEGYVPSPYVGPVPVGRWRNRWWEDPHPQGYRITFSTPVGPLVE
jgi:hypothetical protein